MITFSIIDYICFVHKGFQIIEIIPPFWQHCLTHEEKPWGKFIPKLADGDKPNQGEINSQRLYTEPEGLNIDGELPAVPKDSFKKGVYY